MDTVRNYCKSNSAKKIYSYLLIIFLIIGILGIAIVLIRQPKRDAGVEFTKNENSKIELYDGVELKIEYKADLKSLLSMGVFTSQDGENPKAKIYLKVIQKDGKELHQAFYDTYLIKEDTYLSIIMPTSIPLQNPELTLHVYTQGVSKENAIYVYHALQENDGVSYLNDTEIENIAFICKGRNPSLFYLWYPIFLIAFTSVLITLNDWTVIKRSKKYEKQKEY